jgi:hypothetical protein
MEAADRYVVARVDTLDQQQRWPDPGSGTWISP